MKAITTIVFTILSFLAIPALVLATATPVHASGDECHYSRGDDDDCHEKTPDAIPAKDRHHHTGRNILAAIVTGCVIEPVVTAYVWPTIKSAFTWEKPRYRKMEWFKCMGGADKKPPPDPGPTPYSDVTPVIPADNGQVYIFKGR